MPDWFVFELAFIFFSSAGWHQFHFPSFLVNCSYVFKRLMNMARLWGASWRYVRQMERGVLRGPSQLHVNYLPINPGVRCVSSLRFRASDSPPFRRGWGCPGCLSSCTGGLMNHWFFCRVTCLCAQFEAVLQHGLKRSRGLALTAAAIKQAAGFASKTETGTAWPDAAQKM